MQYHVRLSITYHYARPTSGGRHLLRLLPQHIPGVQEVSNELIAISPRPAERAEFTDFFGNRTVEVALGCDHSEIVFTATCKVDRLFEGPAEDRSPPPAALRDQIAAHRDLGPAAPHHFLAPSPRIHAVAVITDYVRQQMAGAATVRGAVEALGLALHRDMRFDGSATTVDTPPEEAFTHRHGVCQDFAQIMIAGLRGVGVPAAYVSGYLRTVPPPGRPRLEGSDAMHAWVRAWCGSEDGWIDYDPTNACFAGLDHMSAAVGRDYGDVAPVSGILRTSGDQKTSHAVDVNPL
ncbi:transglutaminase family protein [Cereibacter sphaeroides]|uniref:transglutaminase family protein n=1 Tax=Cereibacter sphaeroides TaxID=1063 RepID=UPI001F18F229|nr:transglutaminase family protein [Cereibacter sphaeroides]MCE6951254.1 transglutaminase family protein [Cereibacter sphaeroides]